MINDQLLTERVEKLENSIATILPALVNFVNCTPDDYESSLYDASVELIRVIDSAFPEVAK